MFAGNRSARPNMSKYQCLVKKYVEKNGEEKKRRKGMSRMSCALNAVDIPLHTHFLFHLSQAKSKAIDSLQRRETQQQKEEKKERKREGKALCNLFNSLKQLHYIPTQSNGR